MVTQTKKRQLTKEQQEYITENYYLLENFIRSKMPRNKNKVDYDELVGELHERFCLAVMGYDPSWGTKLSSFVYGGFRFGLRAFLRSKYKNDKVEDIGSTDQYDILPIRRQDKIIPAELLRYIIDEANLSERTTTMIYLHFFEKKTLVDLSHLFRITPQRVGQVIREGIDRIKELCAKMKYQEEDFLVEKDRPHVTTLWWSSSN